MFSVDLPHSDPMQDVDLAALARVVLYFDVFRHPVRVSEAAWMCGGDIGAAVAEGEQRGVIASADGFLFRPGRSANLERRRDRAVHAERLWPSAMAAARLLARMPFVRGVMLTGGLAKQSAEPGGDADFLLLIEPGCVWTAKSALQVFRRGLPSGLRRLFCTNYLLGTDSLALDDQDVFTAFELATAVPLAGPICADFVRANPWAQRWVPGLEWAASRAESVPATSTTPSLLVPLARRWDAPLQARWDRLWDQKYHWLDDDVRARRFKRSGARATNHLHDFRGFVVNEYRQRCIDAGVDPLQDPVGAA